jgi:hypothetical protein
MIIEITIHDRNGRQSSLCIPFPPSHQNPLYFYFDITLHRHPDSIDNGLYGMLCGPVLWNYCEYIFVVVELTNRVAGIPQIGPGIQTFL